VTETGLAFLQDARRRGDVCRPLDWMTEVHHPISNGQAVIPDALLYYRQAPTADGSAPMLPAFIEVDRATMGPERLAAKLTAYERLHSYVPTVPGRRPTIQQPGGEAWRRRYPVFPRLLFVLDGTGPVGIENRISALHAATRELALHSFVHEVPVLAAALTDLLQDGPSAHVWRPVQDPDRRVSWHQTRRT
jgi:hypothetical protein